MNEVNSKLMNEILERVEKLERFLFHFQQYILTLDQQADAFTIQQNLRSIAKKIGVI
jgi:hypothetical protein